MRPNFDEIDDAEIKDLAIVIYNALSITRNITVFEILVNDIYCQVGKKESFVFSVEVRGNDAEFFLYDFNFLLSNTGDYQIFRANILIVIESVLTGDYEIENVKLGKLTLSSTIVFLKKLRVQLYRSFLLSFFNSVQLNFTTRSTKGKAIITSYNQ